jgi:hypothetical protein
VKSGTLPPRSRRCTKCGHPCPGLFPFNDMGHGRRWRTLSPRSPFDCHVRSVTRMRPPTLRLVVQHETNAVNANLTEPPYPHPPRALLMQHVNSHECATSQSTSLHLENARPGSDTTLCLNHRHHLVHPRQEARRGPHQVVPCNGSPAISHAQHCAHAADSHEVSSIEAPLGQSSKRVHLPGARAAPRAPSLPAARAAHTPCRGPATA